MSELALGILKSHFYTFLEIHINNVWRFSWGLDYKIEIFTNVYKIKFIVQIEMEYIKPF